jgi:hypothetical protein
LDPAKRAPLRRGRCIILFAAAEWQKTRIDLFRADSATN